MWIRLIIRAFISILFLEKIKQNIMELAGYSIAHSQYLNQTYNVCQERASEKYV